MALFSFFIAICFDFGTGSNSEMIVCGEAPNDF